jgi:hypothetical protein
MLGMASVLGMVRRRCRVDRHPAHGIGDRRSVRVIRPINPGSQVSARIGDELGAAPCAAKVISLPSVLGVVCGFRRVHLHPAYWVRNGVRGIVAPISRAAPASLGVVMLDRGRRSSA